MIRQCVCSLPWRLRALLGYDKLLCSPGLRAFTDEVQRSLRRRAKKALGLDSVHQAHTGGITICQRFDSALRPGVHLHSLFLDGVYVEFDDGSLEFHELPEPSLEQVAEVARRTAQRVAILLEKAGRMLDPEMTDDGGDDWSRQQPALARGLDLTGERAGLASPHRAGPGRAPGASSRRRRHQRACAVAIEGRDKKRLERMCRYLARPPIAQDRLELRDDGRVEYTMKKGWRDGARASLLGPLDLIARLCAMIPPLLFNLAST